MKGLVPPKHLMLCWPGCSGVPLAAPNPPRPRASPPGGVSGFFIFPLWETLVAGRMFLFWGGETARQNQRRSRSPWPCCWSELRSRWQKTEAQPGRIAIRPIQALVRQRRARPQRTRTIVCRSSTTAILIRIATSLLCRRTFRVTPTVTRECRCGDPGRTALASRWTSSRAPPFRRLS